MATVYMYDIRRDTLGVYTLGSFMTIFAWLAMVLAPLLFISSSSGLITILMQYLLTIALLLYHTALL